MGALNYRCHRLKHQDVLIELQVSRHNKEVLDT